MEQILLIGTLKQTNRPKQGEGFLTIAIITLFFMQMRKGNSYDALLLVRSIRESKIYARRGNIGILR